METAFQIVRSFTGHVSIRRRPAVAAPERIDVSDPAQVAHWCRELSVTWLELLSAIERVGPEVAAVKLALRHAVR